jgi:hypothetical protein
MPLHPEIRRFLRGVIRDPWPEVVASWVGVIVVSQVLLGFAIHLVETLLEAQLVPARMSPDEFGFGLWCIGRGVGSLFWSVPLLFFVGHARETWISGKRRKAGLICGWSGGSILIFIIGAHLTLHGGFDGETEQSPLPARLASLELMLEASLDSCVLTSALLVLAARPLARGDWEEVLEIP